MEMGPVPRGVLMGETRVEREKQKRGFGGARVRQGPQPRAGKWEIKGHLHPDARFGPLTPEP